MLERKYTFRYCNPNELPKRAFVWAISEAEAIRSLKEAVGNCHNLEVLRYGKWREPVSEFYHVRLVFLIAVLSYLFYLAFMYVGS